MLAGGPGADDAGVGIGIGIGEVEAGGGVPDPPEAGVRSCSCRFHILFAPWSRPRSARAVGSRVSSAGTMPWPAPLSARLHIDWPT
jgi:hypothetical protein